jgi:hypothetical protein
MEARMRLLKNSVLSVSLLLIMSAQGTSQTALESTTLAEAVDGEETVIDVTSVSGFEAGDIAVVNAEAMRIVSVNSTTNRLTVVRGQEGTRVENHSSARTIYVNPPSRYIQDSARNLPRLFGACTAGSEDPNYTPLISLPSGRQYVCTNSYWREIAWQETTIGQAQAVDTAIFFDGNSKDYHIGLDDSSDDFVIGLGTVVGTTSFWALDENGDIIHGGTTPVYTIGDGDSEDAQIKFDGNAQDFSIGLDDSSDVISFVNGATLGQNLLMELEAQGTSTNVRRALFYGSNPGTAADNDVTYIAFTGENDAGGQAVLGRLKWKYLDVSAADDDSEFIISTFVNNSIQEVLSIGSASASGDHPTVRMDDLDLGDDIAGPRIHIGRNSNSTNSNSGTLSFDDIGGTTHYIWLDNSASPGDLRVNTAAPASSVADTAGTIVGTQSSAMALKNIHKTWNDSESMNALNTVLNTPVYDFTYKGKYDGQVFTGVAIPDGEVPWFGYDVATENDIVPEGTAKSLNEISVAGYLILSVKALNQKIDTQNQMIAQLQIQNRLLAANLDRVIDGDPLLVALR